MNLNNLYQWDSHIFDSYVLPDPITMTPDYEGEHTYSIALDHDLMTSAIMMRCGLLEPIYNDPVTFKSALETWFVMHRWNIEHLMRLACQNYNPLENYDRWEHLNNKHTQDGDETEKHTGDDIDKTAGTDSEVHSGDDVTKLTGSEKLQQGGNVTTETTVSAFNESNYQPDNKVVETRNNTDTTTYDKTETLTHGEKIDTKYGKTDTFTHGENITTEFGKIDNDTSNNHLHGNIGVTTYTQMAEQEIALVKSFNIYDTVVSLLEDDLFISVY
jgi:hypothetical protein